MQENNSIRKWLLSLLLFSAAVLSMTSVVDQRASAEYEQLFQRALVTFALARTINGVISVVQGTEIALQPAGVGVTLTPGEILDPVNDLIERFSWIMMAATVSLGIQNVLLEVSAWWLVRTLVAVLCVWVLLRLWYPVDSGRLPKLLLKRLLLLFLFIRFAVPSMLITNDLLYSQFLESRYQESTQLIVAAGEELEKLSAAAEADSSDSEDSGFITAITDAWSNTIDSLDMDGKLDRMQTRASEVVEHLVQLSVVFILQTGILPVAFLWIFLQIFKGLFRSIRIGTTQEQ